MATEKEMLYRFVDDLKEQLCIPTFIHPINTVEMCKRIDQIDVVSVPFSTPGMCGLATLGNKTDTILLNSKRSKLEQNFDCTHELIHVTRHRNCSSCFSCFSETYPHQNSYLEWQANEGAAQFLVPYQDFIPRFLRAFTYRETSGEDLDIIGTLAFHYGVTTQVIRNRIECLSYEMDQYQEGKDLMSLQLLSKNQRTKKGIRPTNYLVLCEFPPNWDSEI